MRILPSLFGIYAALVFIFSLLVLIPFYVIVFVFFSKNKSPRTAHSISRIWAYFLFFAFFIRVKVSGKEKLDPSETYVIISNHQSQLDIPLIAVSCKNTFRFLAKAELGKIPLLGYIIKNLYITVDRSKTANKNRTIDAMINSLKAGISVLIFPEGTRNRTEGELLNFHDGAFKLAIQAQLPIAVLTIKNSNQLQSPSRPFELSPGTIRAAWSDPISTTGLTSKDAGIIKEKVRLMIIENLNN